MGTQYRAHCPKCGYNTNITLGVGFAYPQVYADVQEKGRCGELGDDIRDFFAGHPDGVIDPEPVILQCEKCGEYDYGSSLRMYVPKNSKKLRNIVRGIWSTAMPFHNAEYIPPGEFENHYKLYKEHLHFCQKCGGNMKMLSEQHINKLKCPSCEDTFLTAEICALWD